MTVFDINQPMLDVGVERARKMGISDRFSWVQGNAEQLPFDDESVDIYTIAFGIRNCTHIDRVLDEAYRVLKPGGRFSCLEFSTVDNTFLRGVYDQYSFSVFNMISSEEEAECLQKLERTLRVCTSFR